MLARPLRNKETQGLYLANRPLPEALLFTIVNSNEAKAASQDSLPGVGFPSASLRKGEGQRLWVLCFLINCIKSVSEKPASGWQNFVPLSFTLHPLSWKRALGYFEQDSSSLCYPKTPQKQKQTKKLGHLFHKFIRKISFLKWKPEKMWMPLRLQPAGGGRVRDPHSLLVHTQPQAIHLIYHFKVLFCFWLQRNLIQESRWQFWH